jgi:hypothetical protein
MITDNETPAVSEDVRTQARFLVAERRGPFDQREQRTITGYAGTIDFRKADRIDHKVLDVAERLHYYCTGTPAPIATPYDLCAHEAGERLAAARAVEVAARDEMFAAKDHVDRLQQTQLMSDGRNMYNVNVVHSTVTQRSEAIERKQETHAAWEEAARVYSIAAAAHTRFLKLRDEHRVNFGATFARPSA